MLADIWRAKRLFVVTGIHHGEHDFGGGNDLAADGAGTFGDTDFGTAGFDQFGADDDLVAWSDGAAEFHFVGAHEVADLVVIGGQAEHEKAGGLGHGLKLEDAWHDRAARKVALEIGFVDGDVLNRDQLVLIHDLGYPVQHDKGVTVWDKIKYLADVDGFGERADVDRGGFGGGLFFGLGVERFLPLLVNGGGKFGVERMAGANGDDVGLDGDADQGDVSDDIEDFVANEFVLKSKGFLGDDFVSLDDDGGVEGAALDEALFEQFLNIFVNGESACRSDLRLIDLGVDVDGHVLGVNPSIIGGGAGDPQAVVGEGDDGAIAVGDGDGGLDCEIGAFLFLVDRFGLVDQVDERAGGAVHNWRLGGVHFDDGVVHTHSAEGGEHVLDGVELDVLRGDRGVTHQVGGHGNERAHFGFAVEIDAAEDDAGVLGGGFDRKGDVLSGVQRFAPEGGFTLNGALLHRN